MPNILVLLAMVLQAQGKLAEAEPLLRESLHLRRKLLPADHPNLADSLAGLGAVLMGNHKAAEAEPLLRESLEIRRKSLPQGHWLTAHVEGLFGSCLADLGRYAEAEPLLLGSYDALKAAPGVPPIHLGPVFRRLIRLYEASGQPDKAAEWRQEQTLTDKTGQRSSSQERGEGTTKR